MVGWVLKKRKGRSGKGRKERNENAWTGGLRFEG